MSGALLASGLVASARAGAAPVDLATMGAAYTQNFNTLASTGTSSTLPTGWALLEADMNANTSYAAGTGSDNTGDTYSFGSSGSSDRALGTLRSNSLNSVIGAEFKNTTGSTITSLTIAYTGEQWRVGNAGRQDRLDFAYSTTATALASTAGTPWTEIDGLDFSTPVFAATGTFDGNAALYRAAVSTTITGLSIANGATFWIRWTDFNAANSDDGLAVDDFSITPFATSALSPNGTACTSGTTCQSTYCVDNVCCGSPCDQGLCDSCANATGTCNTLVTCPAASSQCHDVGTCTPLTGTCTNPVKTGSPTCDDASACTTGETCNALGVCTGGTSSVTCLAPDDCHEIGSCVPADGTCTIVPKANNSPCGVVTACSAASTCQAGVCTAGGAVSCAATDQCHDPGTCDPATGCTNPAKMNGTVCNDGNPCTFNDSCQAGTCVGQQKICVTLDQCRGEGTCNSVGVCDAPLKVNGSTCDDVNECTFGDQCTGGVCGGLPKPDGTACSIGQCVGGTCTAIVDAGPVDTGTADTGTLDSGTVDSTVVDTMVADTSMPDTTVVDSSMPDTTIADTKVADTMMVDTMVADTLVADTGTALDTGTPDDTMVADTGTLDDSATADTSVDTDTGTDVNTGLEEDSGCGCRTAGEKTPNLAWLAAAAVALAVTRRRRQR